MLQLIEDELLDGMTACVETRMQRLLVDSSKLACIAACKDVVLYYERNKALINVLLGEQGEPAFVVRLKDSLKPLWRRYVVSYDVSAPKRKSTCCWSTRWQARCT